MFFVYILLTHAEINSWFVHLYFERRQFDGSLDKRVPPKVYFNLINVTVRAAGGFS